MTQSADATGLERQAEKKAAVSGGGFISKLTKVFVIYFFVNQFGNFLTNNKSGGNVKEESSSVVSPQVSHPLSTFQDMSNLVVQENPDFKYISKLHSYMSLDVDHLSFKVNVEQQCKAELASNHLLKSEGLRILHNVRDSDDADVNVQDAASLEGYVFPTMELREMGSEDPEEDEKKWKQLEDEERKTDENQNGAGLFTFVARELETLWATVTGNGDRKASIAREKEALILKIQKRQKQSSSRSFSDAMPFSLNEAPRFVQKELDITDTFFNNCTLVAQITVTYSKSEAYNKGKGKNAMFPLRVIQISHPLISFVEKEERELMNLFTEDENAEKVGMVDKPYLALEGGNEKQTKKRGRKKSKVISKTKRKKSKVDEAVDTMIMWVKEQVFGSVPNETVVALPTRMSEREISATVADGVVPFSSDEDNKGADAKSSKVKTKMVAKFLPKLTLSPVVDATSYSISDVPVHLKNVYKLVNNPTLSNKERDTLIKQTILRGNTQKLNAMPIEERASYGFYSPLIYLNNFWTVDNHLIELSEYYFRDERTGKNSVSDDEDIGDHHNGVENVFRGANDSVQNIQLNNKLEKLRSDPSQRLKVNFTVEIRPISLLKYMLYTQFDASMDMHEDFGTMTRKERDDTKMMLLETHPVLLVITIAVSVLHMLFEYLAFKNEVKFWKSRKNFKGLSLRTVAVNCYFQTIIFMYLMDSEQTSYMILFPCGIGVIIEFWKLFKTLKIQRNAESGRIEFSFNKSYDSVTSQYDRIAIKWLGITLTPFLIGYTAYSAVYDEHKGWYSFIIATQVRFIYFSGFVMMTPQIFINYKLKSVAQLPWRMFVYRFLNTIIDDLFAFIVTMPTMHRLACFRDDIVFFILLYQRWKYPVDTRRTEDGESIEDHEEDIDKEDSGKLIEKVTEDNKVGAEVIVDGVTAMKKPRKESTIPKQTKSRKMK